MRKKSFLFISIVVLLLVATSLLLFSCKSRKIDDNGNTIVENKPISILTGMNIVYESLKNANKASGANIYTLAFDLSANTAKGAYVATFKGRFDVTEVNRENDLLSQMSFELKKDGVDILDAYYSGGKLYLYYPPYVTRGVTAEINLSSLIYAFQNENKANGAIDVATAALPQVASYIFSACALTSRPEGNEYLFTLSYEQLFNQWDSVFSSFALGITGEDMKNIFALTKTEIADLIANAPTTTIKFVTKKDKFVGASVALGESKNIALNNFSLTTSTDGLAFPPSIATFTDFNWRNISAIGKMDITTSPNNADQQANFDILYANKFEPVKYAFSYELQSYYTQQGELSLCLKLTDPNKKKSEIYVKGNEIYFNFENYGLGKVKTSIDVLKDQLSRTGFYEEKTNTFKEELRAFAWLLSAINKDGDIVNADMAKDLVGFVVKQLGLNLIFDVQEASFSWDKSNNRLQNFAANISFGDLDVAVSSSNFTFGTAVEVPVPTADYISLDTRTSTHLSASGIIKEQTLFADDGAALSTLLSSISGETVTFDEYTGLKYNLDVVYGATGAIKTFRTEILSDKGAEIVTLYYTEKATDNLYLIYPEINGSRKVRTLGLAEDMYTDFGTALGLESASEGKKAYFTSAQKTFKVGIMAKLSQWIIGKMQIIYPDLSLSWARNMFYRRIEIELAEDSITGTMVFDSDNFIIIKANEYAVTYNDEIAVTDSAVDSDIPRVALLQENNVMPNAIDVTFNDGTEWRLSTRNYMTNESAWLYTDVPNGFGSGNNTTTATAVMNIIGETLTMPINVDLSPITNVIFTASDSKYASKYDANIKTLKINRYNDANPKDMLNDFNIMTFKVAGETYVKQIESWNTEGLSTASGSDTFTVKPKVKTFFGNIVELSGESTITVKIEGGKADSVVAPNNTATGYVPYTITFVAYDGNNPMDTSVYSDVLNIQTDDEQVIEVTGVKWVLTTMPNIKKKAEEGTLYEYDTIGKPDEVQAHIYDCTGNYISLSVPVYFRAKKVDTMSFDTTEIDGIDYDGANNKFVFDVLKVSSLTNLERILPRSFIANQGTEKEFEIAGIKWEYDPIAQVMNASGAQGTIKAVVGDVISGYQEKIINFEFTKVNVSGVQLLAEDGESVVAGASDSATYDFVLDELNAYTYQYPKYVRVTYADGESVAYEDIEINWDFDKELTALYEGGEYNATAKLGSETLTLKMIFEEKRIQKINFTAEELAITKGESVCNIDYEAHVDGSLCLTYAVLDVLSDDEDKLDYTKESDFPAKMQVKFYDSDDWLEINVTWNIDVLKEAKNFIGNGCYSTVVADAQGQKVNVKVFVKSAINSQDVVYIDSAHENRNKTFYLLVAEKDEIKTIDPRDVENYPEVLYVVNSDSQEYSVPVLEWDVTAVKSLFAQAILNGENMNEVTGNATCYAKIGNATVGYAKIAVETYILKSNIENITLSSLPLSASTELTGGLTPYAVDIDYTAGTHGDFDYKFTLSLNPFYVIPTANASYPKQICFDLNGVAVKAKALWDLTNIPADAAKRGNVTTYEGDTNVYGYPAYAMIEVENLPNIKVGAEVSIQKREIERVYLPVGADEYSDQPYIFIDCYSEHPFGGDVSGDIVTMDVKVKFAGDNSKYPLKLKYDKKKAGLVLNYGGGEYKGIVMQVGNENGGYQDKTFTIRVLKMDLTSVEVSAADKLSSAPNGLFFNTVYKTGSTEEVVRQYNAVLDMQKALPSSLVIGFNMATSRTINRNVQDAKGLVYEWVRDSEGHMGVEIWNASLTESERGENQCIYNEFETGYNMPTNSMLFGADTWKVTYRDSVDGGCITASDAISEFAENVLTTTFDTKYQSISIMSADGSKTYDAAEVLGAGKYRYHIDIVGHNQFKGEVYKVFTIEPKNIASFVECNVDGESRITTTEDYISRTYSGIGFTVKATSGKYAEKVDLLVVSDGDKASVSLSSVHYENNAVALYALKVKSANANYTVGDNTYVYFKIDEAVLNKSVVVDVDWNGVTFVETVSMDGTPLVKDKGETLTNGYQIKYYKTNVFGVKEEVTTFEVANNYTCRVEVKLPNYKKYQTDFINITAMES